MAKLTDYQRSILATAVEAGCFVLLADYAQSTELAEFSHLKHEGFITTEIGPYPFSAIAIITPAGRAALEKEASDG